MIGGMFLGYCVTTGGVRSFVSGYEFYKMTDPVYVKKFRKYNRIVGAEESGEEFIKMTDKLVELTGGSRMKAVMSTSTIEFIMGTFTPLYFLKAHKNLKFINDIDKFDIDDD